MRRIGILFLPVCAVCAASCVHVVPPNLSTIAHAPECVRGRVDIQSVETQRVHLDYRLSLHTPGEGWTSIPLSVREDRLYTNGIFAHNEQNQMHELDLLIDTGSDAFLGIPLGHPAAAHVWLSSEHGGTSARTLIGSRPAWHGAGCGLIVGDVVIAPAPVTVAGVRRGSAVPWLGHGWFNLLRAVWLDAAGETLAVSHSEGAARAIVDDTPDLWLEVPWRSVREDGPRFARLRLGDQEFDAVIDTGSDMELFVHAAPSVGVARPDRFLLRAWGGRTVGLTSPCDAPVMLGSHRLEIERLAWPERPSAGVRTGHADAPLALLGVPFLRRYPILMDHENNRLYLFVGDRSHLRSPAEQISKTADDWSDHPD